MSWRIIPNSINQAVLLNITLFNHLMGVIFHSHFTISPKWCFKVTALNSMMYRDHVDDIDRPRIPSQKLTVEMGVVQ